MNIKIKNLQKKVVVLPVKIRKAVRKTLQHEGKSLTAKVNVIFVSDAKIRTLNRKFLKKDSYTDVLAFDLGDELDIVVSADTAVRQAKIFQTSTQYELCLYVVHGLLHFLGYDDKTSKQRIKMQKQAEKIICGLVDVHP